VKAVRRAMILLLVAAACGSPAGDALSGGTPPNCTAIIDYVDFVHHQGAFYSAASWFPTLGRAITDSELGPEQFRVRNTVSQTNCDPYRRPVDGDAAYVPTGEPVFAVKGYAPMFRLAARHNGRLVLYEADSNPAALHGSDLLDIAGRVKSIALLDEKSGRSPASRLTDATGVRYVVGLIATASIDHGYRPSSTGSEADFVQLAFELTDGTISVRAYDRLAGVLGYGIRVGPALSAIVDELMRIAPTPSPVPAAINLARRYDLARATRVSVKNTTVQGTVRPAPAVSAFLAFLDADLPARRAARPTSPEVIVIFEFTDRYVSLVYDESAGSLTVVAPDDELAVQVPAGFRALIR
jgi:hypothetical protein